MNSAFPLSWGSIISASPAQSRDGEALAAGNPFNAKCQDPERFYLNSPTSLQPTLAQRAEHSTETGGDNPVSMLAAAGWEILEGVRDVI